MPLQNLAQVVSNFLNKPQKEGICILLTFPFQHFDHLILDKGINTDPFHFNHCRIPNKNLANGVYCLLNFGREGRKCSPQSYLRRTCSKSSVSIGKKPVGGDGFWTKSWMVRQPLFILKYQGFSVIDVHSDGEMRG